MEAARLSLLGGFRLTLSDGAEVQVRGRKKKGLLAFLALSSGCGVRRDKAIGMFWSRRTQQQAQASLRQTLSEMRRELNVVGSELVMADRTAISLIAEKVSIDALEFNRYASSDSFEHWTQAVSLYRGPILDGTEDNDPAFEEWLRLERDRYRDQFRLTLLSLATHYRQVENHDEGVKIANRMLMLDPADEDAFRALMSHYDAMGKRAIAMRQYQRCREILRDDYQVDPSPETTALYERIKSGGVSVLSPMPGRAVPLQPMPLASEPEAALGVVPFVSASGRPEDTQLGAEIAEDTVGALSRFRWISIKPRSEMAAFRRSDMTASAIARELDIRYVVDGVVRRSKDTVNLSVELIDVLASKVVWAERFEGELDASGFHRPLLLSQVASQTEVRLRVQEAIRVLAKPTESLSAYDCVLRALHCMQEMTEASFDSAVSLFDRAQALEPENSAIYSWKALWEIFCIGQGWAAERGLPVEEAGWLAREAIKRDPEDAVARAISGHYEAFVSHRFEQALHSFDQALESNPHSAFAWMLSAATCAYAGDPVEGLRRLEHVRQMGPIEHPLRFMYNSAHCIAYSVSRQPDRAATWGRRTVSENPSFSNGIKQLLINLGHLGLADEAGTYLEKLLALEPDFNLEDFERVYPFGNDADRVYMVEGLRLAGAPDRPLQT